MPGQLRQFPAGLVGGPTTFQYDIDALLDNGNIAPLISAATAPCSSTALANSKFALFYTGNGLGMLMPAS